MEKQRNGTAPSSPPSSPLFPGTLPRHFWGFGRSQSCSRSLGFQLWRLKSPKIEKQRWETHYLPLQLGNVSETPTPTTCPKSTAVHLQFVRQYAPHLYRRTFLASKLRRKGNPAIRLPFVLQYASHLYGSTPPICTAVLLEKYWGLGSPERF